MKVIKILEEGKLIEIFDKIGVKHWHIIISEVDSSQVHRRRSIKQLKLD